MSDAEWKAHLKNVTDPLEMLKIILSNHEYFGYDSYYSDLRRAMLEQVERIVSTHTFPAQPCPTN